MGCSEAAYCRSCSRRQCGYTVSYQEGSSYSGFLAHDVVHFGDAGAVRGAGGAACASFRFAFGCSTDETGLFQSQRADGIMGLASTQRRDAAPSNPTVLEALAEAGVVANAFSLCIGRELGRLTFGMPPDPPGGAAALPPRLWTRVVDSNYPTIGVRAVRYGGLALAPHAPTPMSIGSMPMFSWHASRS